MIIPLVGVPIVEMEYRGVPQTCFYLVPMAYAGRLQITPKAPYSAATGLRSWDAG